MPILRNLLAAFTLCLSGLAFSQSSADSEIKKCALPVPGNFAGSCEALKVKDIAESKHAGDVWIHCEDTSGAHGLGGLDAAMFLAQDARQYWWDETDAYLTALAKLLPAAEFQKLKTQHVKWEEALGPAEQSAYEEAEAEYPDGGTIVIYTGAWNALRINRDHALKLGCMLESRRK
jgi:hypothetical protein